MTMLPCSYDPLFPQLNSFPQFRDFLCRSVHTHRWSMVLLSEQLLEHHFHQKFSAIASESANSSDIKKKTITPTYLFCCVHYLCFYGGVSERFWRVLASISPPSVSILGII